MNSFVKISILLFIVAGCSTGKNIEKTFEAVNKVQDRIVSNLPPPPKDSIVYLKGRTDTVIFETKKNDTVFFSKFFYHTDSIIHYQVDNNKVNALTRLEAEKAGRILILEQNMSELKKEADKGRLYLYSALFVAGCSIGLLIKSKF